MNNFTYWLDTLNPIWGLILFCLIIKGWLWLLTIDLRTKEEQK